MTVEQFEVVWKIAAIVFGAGVFYAELKAIRKDIARLEKKQDKYNTLQERTLKLEVWKEEICRNSGMRANKD